MTNRPIAVFMPSLADGGAERVMLNLASALAESSEVDLLLVRAEGQRLTDVPDNVNLIELGGGKTVQSLRPLVRYLREHRPRVLVTASVNANLIAVIAAGVARVSTPVVITQHNTLSVKIAGRSQLFRQFYRAAVRGLYRRAAMVVSVSGGVASDLVEHYGLPVERSVVIYNPVVTERLRSAADEAPTHPWFTVERDQAVLVAVGRLHEQKDYPTLLRAVRRINDDQNVRLLILGEGPARSELEKLIDDLGLAEQVELAGFVDNPYATIAAADVFVMSSAWEGLPTVLIEALYCGTRIVSTDCPSGPREILRNGSLGSLVPVGDHEALANAIRMALIEDEGAPTDEDAWGAFTEARALESYERLIREVST